MLPNQINNIIINTGNLINCKEFKKKATQSPTEEIGPARSINNYLDKDLQNVLHVLAKVFDSVSCTFKSWLDSVEGNSVADLSHIFCVNKDHAIMVEKEDRINLKISVKVFLANYSTEDLEASVSQVMKDLDVSVIDSLILSLPPPPNAETLTLVHIKPLWKVLEQLVHDGKVVTIGISDLDTHQLAELYDWTEVKPSVNQVNLESCCVMPPEMTAFARANDIQLLTHNDPKDLLPKTLQPKILESGIANPDEWKVNWIVRYSVIVKCRGIIQNKGYVLQFVKESAT